MSQDLTNNPVSVVAGADLSTAGLLYAAVKFDASSGGVVVAGAGDHAIGVLVSQGKAGAAVAVAIDRTCKVQAGCAIAAGAKLICGASGVMVTATLTTGVFARLCDGGGFYRRHHRNVLRQAEILICGSKIYSKENQKWEIRKYPMYT